MPPGHAHLGGRTPAEFLGDYWQKCPLLIRGAFPDLSNPLSPEELAGLALEPGVECRLVAESHGDPPWTLRHGPFQEADFTALPPSHWTLLVQEANAHVPQVAALLDSFRFLPNWRLDDVMVSYAADQGSVGPHVDSYDVFLIQGLGRRRWAIGEVCEQPELIPDLPLQVMAGFTPTESWILEPGDMLYLPPNVPHCGVAEGPCMTYSVGFRAPTHQELLGGFLEQVVTHADPRRRYGDPDLEPTDRPGRIAPEVFQDIHAIIRGAVADDGAIDDWFARFMTEPKGGPLPRADDAPAWDELAEVLDRTGSLARAGDSRWAYRETAHGPLLYVDGHAYPLADGLSPLATVLCDAPALDQATLAPYLDRDPARDLLCRLAAQGAIVPPDDGD